MDNLSVNYWKVKLVNGRLFDIDVFIECIDRDEEGYYVREREIFTIKNGRCKKITFLEYMDNFWKYMYDWEKKRFDVMYHVLQNHKNKKLTLFEILYRKLKKTKEIKGIKKQRVY